MIGVHYEDNHVATGFGNHLALPIFRDEWHNNMSFEDGVKLLEKRMRVLPYRDRSAINMQASETEKIFSGRNRKYFFRQKQKIFFR
ncbi:hypothetical protein LguiB_012383 [Lonicera macranthoides]